MIATMVLAYEEILNFMVRLKLVQLAAMVARTTGVSGAASVWPG